MNRTQKQFSLTGVSLKKIKFLSVVCLSILGFCLPTRATTLLGIDSDTGNLYQVSTANASLTLIGNTGIATPADLQFAPDGALYSFSVGTNSTLYHIDPNTAHATSIGLLGVGNVFEGGLAFSPDGIAYGCNAGTAAAANLFKLNLTTGQATIVATISGGSHDIDGLDAAVKVAALVTVLMGVRISLNEIDRTGIGGLSGEAVRAARAEGKPYKLVCRAHREGSSVKASVRPEQVPLGDPMAWVAGTSSIVYFETDIFPGLVITENDPGVEATAYGMLADFVRAVSG